jgi:hypothetical protein
MVGGWWSVPDRSESVGCDGQFEAGGVLVCAGWVEPRRAGVVGEFGVRRARFERGSSLASKMSLVAGLYLLDGG